MARSLLSAWRRGRAQAVGVHVAAVGGGSLASAHSLPLSAAAPPLAAPRVSAAAAIAAAAAAPLSSAGVGSFHAGAPTWQTTLAQELRAVHADPVPRVSLDRIDDGARLCEVRARGPRGWGVLEGAVG